MAGVPLTRSADLREKLLDALPANDWSIAKAGVAVGYSKQYAETRLALIIKKDVEFCRRINERRNAMTASKASEIDKLTQSWQKIAHDETVAVRDRLKAGDLLGKTFGIFSETRVIETSQRQQQLTKAEENEAKRLLALRLDTTSGYGIPATGAAKSLCAGDIAGDSDIIDAEAEPNDTQSSDKACANDEDTASHGEINYACEHPDVDATDSPLPPNDRAEHRSPIPPGNFPGGTKGTDEVDNPIS